jgi:hypothetical protein
MPIPDSDKTKQIQLSNNDKVFENIRNMHISEVSTVLRNLIAEMKNIYEVYLLYAPFLLFKVAFLYFYQEKK